MKTRIFQLAVTGALFFQTEARATKDRSRRLEPEEAGEIHNRVCLQVRDRIAEKNPETKAEAFRYLTEELLTLCDDDDTYCHSQMRSQSARAQFQNFEHRDYKTMIDDVMPYFTLDDMELKRTLKDIYFTIDLLDTMSVADIQDAVHKIADEYSETNNSDAKKNLVRTVSSVAASSTELWMSVFSDPNDAYHNLNRDGRNLLVQERSLQLPDIADIGSIGFQAGDALFNAVNVIQSDVLGGITSTLLPAIEATIMGDMSGLTAVMLSGIITNSVGAAFSSFGINLQGP